MISYIKLSLLALLAVALVFLWNYPFMLPLKVFVVYLHEISHGLGALLTGGSVTNIVVKWNESGITYTKNGNFLTTATFGYVGSILWGSLMLNAAVKRKFTRIISFVIGLNLLFFTTFYMDIEHKLIYFMAISWGIVFTISAAIFERFNRILLFFLGGATSLYAFYDLGDFFRGDILRTDAGIIAEHYFEKNTAVSIPLAYLIAIAISALSIWILYRILSNAVLKEEKLEEETEFDLAALDELTPELLEMQEFEKFKQFQQMSRNYRGTND